MKPSRGSRSSGTVGVSLCSWWLILALESTGLAADASKIRIPKFQDKYSALVKKLESGDTNINYREFRESFLESKQMAIAEAESSKLKQLRGTFPALIERSDYSALLRATQKVLSIDYTDMLAHKILYQTYKLLGDEANRKKYHDIELGLLKSIVDNGNGKSCPSAWPVIQVEEEYFILEMLGATLIRQTIDTQGGVCDKMDVSSDHGNAVYYFAIEKLLLRREKAAK